MLQIALDQLAQPALGPRLQRSLRFSGLGLTIGGEVAALASRRASLIGMPAAGPNVIWRRR